MALDSEIRKKDLSIILGSTFWKQNMSVIQKTDSSSYQENIERKAVRILHLISEMAASQDLSLLRQPKAWLENMLRAIINSLNEQVSNEGIANRIYINAMQELNKKSNVVLANSVGRFDRLPLHKCAENQQMTDMHINQFMPPSSKKLQILAAYRIGDEAHLTALKEGLQKYLDDKAVNTIIIPVGPGHWRDIVINKKAEGCLAIQVFDSMGQQSARGIKQSLLAFLKVINIAMDKVAISYVGPKITQTDSFSCGDYAVAFAHKVAKTMGEVFNQDIINTYVSKGNKNDALRALIRGIDYAENQALQNQGFECQQTIDALIATKPAVALPVNSKINNIVENTLHNYPDKSPTEVKKALQEKIDFLLATKIQRTQFFGMSIKDELAQAQSQLALVIDNLDSSSLRF